MENRLLEIGDIILRRHFGQLSFYGKIDRVTKTLAFIGNSKYKREICNGKTVAPLPRNYYSSAYFFVADEKDLEKIKKQQMADFVARFNYSKLPYEKMVEVYNILKRED